MELVLNRLSMFQSFANEWKLRWVPAVMRYCKSLKKKDVVKALSTANDLYSSGTYIHSYLVAHFSTGSNHVHWNMVHMSPPCLNGQ